MENPAPQGKEKSFPGVLARNEPNCRGADEPQKEWARGWKRIVQAELATENSAARLHEVDSVGICSKTMTIELDSF